MFTKHTTGLVASLLAVLPTRPADPHHKGRTRYAAGWRHIGKGRWRPHQNKREIERRLKQASRDEARQLAGAAACRSCPPDSRISRRGWVIG